MSQGEDVLARPTAVGSIGNPYPPLRDSRFNQIYNGTRVLDLNPGTTGELKGKLRVISLVTRPKYEALSYTWGDSTKGRIIKLNDGYSISITDNLYNALRWLRKPVSTRTIWVDALCINQADLDERSQQVAVMGDIYRQATGVLIWLGEYEDARRIDSCRMSSGSDEASVIYRSDSAMRLATALDGAMQECRPQWISRAWIIQEFALPVKVVFCCGGIQVGFDKLQELFKREGRIAEYILHDCPHLSLFKRKMTGLQKIRSYVDGQRPTLIEAVLHSTGSECQDLRDKIYSLLGLIDTKEARLIRPRYHYPISRMFIAATFASITVQRRFNIFVLLPITKQTSLRSDLPTWVPDFAVTIPERSRRSLEEVYRLTIESPRFYEDHLPGINRDKTALKTMGRALGEIAASMAVPASLSGLHDPLLDLLAHLKTAFFLRDRRSDTTKEFWPLKDFDPESVPGPNPGIKHARKMIPLVFELWNMVAGWDASLQTDQTPFWVGVSDWGLRRGTIFSVTYVDAGLASFLDYAISLTNTAMFFVCTSGRVGVATAVVLPGDSVVLLPGIMLPVVLRPVGEAYEFQALAYVNGMSDMWYTKYSDELRGVPFQSFTIL